MCRITIEDIIKANRMPMTKVSFPNLKMANKSKLLKTHDKNMVRVSVNYKGVVYDRAFTKKEIMDAYKKAIDKVG